MRQTTESHREPAPSGDPEGGAVAWSRRAATTFPAISSPHPHAVSDMRASFRVLALATLILFNYGCATTRGATPTTAATPPVTTAAPSTASPTRTLPRDIRWVRNSAEYRALTSQV